MGWSISLRNTADELPSAAAKENTGESVIDAVGGLGPSEGLGTSEILAEPRSRGAGGAGT